MLFWISFQYYNYSRFPGGNVDDKILGIVTHKLLEQFIGCPTYNLNSVSNMLYSGKKEVPQKEREREREREREKERERHLGVDL